MIHFETPKKYFTNDQDRFGNHHHHHDVPHLTSNEGFWSIFWIWQRLEHRSQPVLIDYNRRHSIKNV